MVIKQNSWLNGIFENPILVLTLGLCPVIGVSRTLQGALYMGICTLIVLFFSNIIISSFKNIIGDKIRIVAYILIIATFVTVIKILTETFFASIYVEVGNYIALIVVNCLILGRAESFVRKNSVGKAAIDGLSMGIGFVVVISILGLVREMFGMNSIGLFNITKLFGANFVPLSILSSTAGGLFMLAIFILMVNGVKLLCKKGGEK